MPLLTVANAADLAVRFIEALRFRAIVSVAQLKSRSKDLLRVLRVPHMNGLLVERCEAHCVGVVDDASGHLFVLRVLDHRALAEVQAHRVAAGRL